MRSCRHSRRTGLTATARLLTSQPFSHRATSWLLGLPRQRLRRISSAWSANKVDGAGIWHREVFSVHHVGGVFHQRPASRDRSQDSRVQALALGHRRCSCSLRSECSLNGTADDSHPALCHLRALLIEPPPFPVSTPRRLPRQARTMLPRPDRAGPPRPTGPGRIEHRQVSPRRPHVGTPGGHLRSTSRASDFQIWDGLHQIQADSSSSEEDLHPSPRRASRPRHTRSMSHPFLSFPSLFSSKKKRSGPMAGAAADDDSGSESGGESTRTPSVRGRQQPPPRPGHRNGSSGGSRDFVTGRCMTCGSLVRWPRELHVFKCSICLTVNDLRFEGRPARPEEPQGGSANGMHFISMR